MTDIEIKKALECCSTGVYVCDIEECPLKDSPSNTISECRFDLVKLALDLINRQKAEIDELTEKLECLLCHATGSKLSKSTYSLRTMESAVNDEVQECCEEARAEAIKEFAERLKKKMVDMCYAEDAYIPYPFTFIDNLVKEMVGKNK